LAGLFCASLGVMDEQRTTSPSGTFRPEGSLPDWGQAHHLRHGFLPSEHVCTENLTPFYKLLPCKSFSGIATLLNPHKLFDADWHGMSIHVLWKEDVGIQVRLTFQAVLDPIRNSWNKKRGRSCQVGRRSNRGSLSVFWLKIGHWDRCLGGGSSKPVRFLRRVRYGSPFHKISRISSHRSRAEWRARSLCLMFLEVCGFAFPLFGVHAH